MTNTYIYNLGAAFYHQAAANAARTALLYPSGQRVTYEALNAHSNKIARALLELGITKGDVVCLFNNKSFSAFASMLACLKIGAPYANLDVSSPWQRIDKMLHTCRPKLVLYDGASNEIVESAQHSHGISALGLQSEEFGDVVEHQSSDDLNDHTHAITGADPAYVMFTSGSTGFPKGAVMSHANVLSFIRWGQATFDVTPDDVFTNVNPIYFDNSVFDFYTALFCGATLCPVTADITSHPRRLVDCINELKCTIWFSVPSLLVYLLTMKAIREDDFSSVTRIVFGGEGFPKSKLKTLYTLLGDRVQLVNVYGPTECTCICSSHIITAQDIENQKELAPLGHLAPNFDYYIEPVSEEDPTLGELYLAGPNVGLGYYNDAARTCQSFVQDPTNQNYRRIMYKTGDLVQKGENGYLYFKGRVDNQIKHMGYRIELEEIEAAFNSLEYIHEVGVVYKQGENGLGQIVAFVNSANGISEKEIISEIKKIVPPYMVPRKVHLKGTLPKNRNGKVDRNQLKELV